MSDESPPRRPKRTLLLLLALLALACLAWGFRGVVGAEVLKWRWVHQPESRLEIMLRLDQAGPESLPYWDDALRHEDDKVAHMAVEQIGRAFRGEPALPEALERALRYPNPRVRGAAVEVLARHPTGGEERWVAGVFRMLTEHPKDLNLPYVRSPIRDWLLAFPERERAELLERADALEAALGAALRALVS